ncbi:hypothetical protein F5H01DRAFT_317591 [Linnemannia elongata]|nr:hypothetical protein F5H01DRAFT_317591 [Linnemannia elongata]
MTNDSSVQPHSPGDGNKPNNNHPTMKQDNIIKRLGLPISNNKRLKHRASNQSLTAQVSPRAAVPPVISQPSVNNRNDSQSVSTIAPEDKPLPTPPVMANAISDIFLENMPKPVIRADLPAHLDRIEAPHRQPGYHFSRSCSCRGFG